MTQQPNKDDKKPEDKKEDKSEGMSAFQRAALYGGAALTYALATAAMIAKSKRGGPKR